MLEIADRLFRHLRSIPFFLRLTWFTRILLVAGFVPTGLVKLLGRRFTTTVSVDNPVGAFFEALYQTGPYWQFLGASQVVAGLLLLSPRTAHLGALLFLPIMVNIFVITVSMGFGGTSIVTLPMLLAVIYLCAWDYHRFRGLVTERPLPPDYGPPQLTLDPLERIGFRLFGVAVIAFFFVTRAFAPASWGLPAVGLGFAAGLFTLARFLTTGRRLTASAPRLSEN